MQITFGDLSRYHARCDELGEYVNDEADAVLESIEACGPARLESIKIIRGYRIPTDRGSCVIFDAINGRFTADQLVAARCVLRDGGAPFHVWESCENVDICLAQAV
jgi:hypothetical protein